MDATKQVARFTPNYEQRRFFLKLVNAMGGAMSDVTEMPVAFISHGSPMNLLENNSLVVTWRELGQMLPRPRATLAISAH